MLCDQGVSRVTMAADGNKALAELQGARHPPDIIICGINMPSTNGFQMLEMPAHRYMQSILCMYFIGGSK
jgi:YesN/AraC family two-component response regulator